MKNKNLILIKLFINIFKKKLFMYSFQIKYSEILTNTSNYGNIQSSNLGSSEPVLQLKENLQNDFELLKTMYMDDIEVLLDYADNISDANAKKEEKDFAFKIKLLYEYEINKNFFDIIQELKIPDISDKERNKDFENTDKRILNLPYYVAFYTNAEGIQVDIFVFWIKKSFSFFEDFRKIIANELKEDLTLNSFFFSFIECLKSNIIEPDKNHLLFLLQEINEICLIKGCKDSFYSMLKEFYNKRKKINCKKFNYKILSDTDNAFASDNNLIFGSFEEVAGKHQEELGGKEDFDENIIENEGLFLQLDSCNNINIGCNNFHNNNSLSLNIDQIKKRSDRLIENTISKKNLLAILNKASAETTALEGLSLSDYELFFSSGGCAGEVLTDRGSSFQGHVIKITAFDQVAKFTKILLSNNKIQKATHNIMAYRYNTKDIAIKGKEKEPEKEKAKEKSLKSNIAEGFDDDGEAGAGTRLLGILQKMKVYNILVVVSRWFGGTLLGNDRFKHINDTAKNLILNNKSKFSYET